MTVTLSLRFLYIFCGSGLLCAVANITSARFCHYFTQPLKMFLCLLLKLSFERLLKGLNRSKTIYRSLTSLYCIFRSWSWAMPSR